MTSQPLPADGTGRPPTARLPRTARRAQLLTAALEVFVAQGYHAAAMDDIADHAGVSKPVLYQHFPGKRDLYLALLETHSAELLARVHEAIDSTTDNKARVHNAVQAYYDFVGNEGGAFRLVFETDLGNDPDVRGRVDKLNTACIAAVADTIAADTGLPRTHAELVSAGLIGSAQVSAQYWLQTHRRLDKSEAIELLAAVSWRGISGFPLQGEHGEVPRSAQPGNEPEDH